LASLDCTTVNRSNAVSIVGSNEPRKAVVIVSGDVEQGRELLSRVSFPDVFVVVFADLEAARSGWIGAPPDLVVVARSRDADGKKLVTVSSSFESGESNCQAFHLPAEEALFNSAVQSILKPGRRTDAVPCGEPQSGEDRFRQLFEHSHIGMAMVGRDHRFVKVNRAYCRMTGYSENELTSMTFSDITHPDDRAADLEPARQLYAGEVPYYRTEKRYVRKDQEVIWVRLNSWMAGDLEGPSIAIIEDITSRVESERQRLKLITAVEQAAEGIVITDSTGNIQYCNPAFERQSGYSRREAAGQNPRFLQSGKHDVEFYRNLWDTVNGGKVWEGRITNKRKDGSLIEEEMTISPVYECGKIGGFVALKRDVTERISLENQLRQAQKLESIGQLAGGVAHDFNNLLTIINGYSDYVMELLPSVHPARLSLGEIRKAGDRAAELTRQLLTFSRRSDVFPKTISLDELLLDIEKMLKRLIGECVEVILEPRSEQGLIRADAGLIEQVVMNLAVNARDAMPDGGKLFLQTSRIEIADEFNALALSIPLGRYISLAVSDTGTGMTPEVQAHLFEPFFTTKEPGRGTGLGLSTVYGIVQQSGAFIRVHSAVGLGTTIRIFFPALDDGEPEIDRPDPVVPASRGTETVLVVEDESGVRLFIRDVLEANGYSVLMAADGAEALELARHHRGPIHILLSDTVLPGMKGAEVVRQFQALRPGVPVLNMSGYPQQFGAGLIKGNPYLAKPFGPGALLARVREVLGNSATPQNPIN